jgi:hypothetical protein
VLLVLAVRLVLPPLLRALLPLLLLSLLMLVLALKLPPDSKPQEPQHLRYRVAM